MNVELIDGPLDGAVIGDPIAPSIWPTGRDPRGEIRYLTCLQVGKPRYDRCDAHTYLYVGDSHPALYEGQEAA